MTSSLEAGVDNTVPTSKCSEELIIPCIQLALSVLMYAYSLANTKRVCSTAFTHGIMMLFFPFTIFHINNQPSLLYDNFKDNFWFCGLLSFSNAVNNSPFT